MAKQYGGTRIIAAPGVAHSFDDAGAACSKHSWIRSAAAGP